MVKAVLYLLLNSFRQGEVFSFAARGDFSYMTAIFYGDGYPTTSELLLLAAG